LPADAHQRPLRSTASRTQINRAFVADGPGLWNRLPSHLKETDLSYNRFWRSPKTFLFG